MQMRKDDFVTRLQQRYGVCLTLVQDFDAIDCKEPVSIHCSDCGLISSLSYKTLFNKETVKGCSYCRHNRKHRVYGFTNDLFLQAAQNKWGDRFRYQNLDIKREIKAEDQQIDIFCTVCSIFFKTNIRYHLYLNPNGGGCVSCSKRLNKISYSGSTESFIKLAKAKWGDLYDYSAVCYSNIDTEVKIYCRTHKEYFFLTPYKHLNNKYGCPVCGNKRKNDHTKIRVLSAFNTELERRSQQDDLNLTAAEYSGFLSPIALQCKQCGCHFSTIGQHFINKGGRCPICFPPRSFSRISQEAIRSICEVHAIQFISSLIGYEHKIIREKNIFKVDAYNEGLNLILEFYGDLFHGNPLLFSSDTKCHPYYKDVTAQELYTKTKEREQFLLDSGYNLITIWESDWRADSKAVLARVGTEIDAVRSKQCV
jgi:hypothetical protein